MLIQKKSILYFLAFLILIVGNCSLNAYAQSDYLVEMRQNGDILCSYDGVIQKKIYLPILQEDYGYRVVEPFTSGSMIYYFDNKGIGKIDKKNHFIKLKNCDIQNKYFSQKGKLVRNQIAGNKDQGFYFVGKDGLKVTDKTTKKAVEFVRKHTNSNDPKSVKLKKCYIYLASHYQYKRIYTVSLLYPNASDMDDIAYEMFRTKKGNCHRFAACFSYIARVLGYESQVGVGKIKSYSNLPGAGGGYTPHGWSQVKINGKWYQFDPDLDMHTSTHTYYFKRSNLGYRLTRLCISYSKNSKIRWKEVKK